MSHYCPDCGARAVYSIIGGELRCRDRCGWQGRASEADREVTA